MLLRLIREARAARAMAKSLAEACRFDDALNDKCLAPNGDDYNEVWRCIAAALNTAKLAGLDTAPPPT
jgi:hypothetical protein